MSGHCTGAAVAKCAWRPDGVRWNIRAYALICLSGILVTENPQLHISTPLIESLPLSRTAGRPVWLKLEALQPPGSFKIRGIGLACVEYRRRGATRFVSSSGGNAGIAVAWAGRRLGVPVTVVVPETTSERARGLIREHGADLVVRGASWQEANEHALSLLGGGGVLIHPFDDPLLWQGHASMIDELAAVAHKPGAVVLSVGGGGLLAGVIKGLRRNGWANVPVIAVETEGAASLAASLAAGSRVSLPAITSIATSLGARQVCEQAFRVAGEHPLQSVVVSDLEAVEACLRFVEDHRLVVEPACGAALAVAGRVPGSLSALEDSKDLLVVVCGGATAGIEQLRAWREALA